MARRIPLPRLTQSQRTARWQRERRQQAIIVVAFTTVLVVAVGLLGWAAASTYYQANLRPAARVGGVALPWRDYVAERQFQLVKFYNDNRVPPEYENDAQLAQAKASFEASALSSIVEFALLREEAQKAGIAPTAAEIDARYAADFGQFRSRHVLVTADANATDKDAADKAALAKAQALVQQLRAAPRDDDLWKKIAAESSADPGSKDQGGELGWVGAGQFVKEYESAAKALKPYEITDPVKSAFGYHIIQLEETRGPEFSDLIARWQRSGVTTDDIREHVRLALIRDAIRQRQEKQAVTSPAPQVRVARISIDTPPPTTADPAAFSEAIRKLGIVSEEIKKPGADFAALAKQYSDDPAAQQGGEVGWLARGMLVDLQVEDDLFRLDAGTVTSGYVASGATTYYKVLEKDPARAITEEQRSTITSQAYNYWYAKLKQERGVQRLVPGHEFD